MKHDDVYTWIIKQPYTLKCGDAGECYGPTAPQCSWRDKSSTAQIEFTLADIGATPPSKKCAEALGSKCFHNSANFWGQADCISKLQGPGEACDGENFWPKSGIPDFAYFNSVSIPPCDCTPTIDIYGASINRRDTSPTRQDMHNLNQQIKQLYQQAIRRQLSN